MVYKPQCDTRKFIFGISNIWLHMVAENFLTYIGFERRGQIFNVPLNVNYKDMNMSTIWRKTGNLDVVSQLSKDTKVEHLGIEFTEIGSDYLKATMPVDSRTHQPMGLLHGGASVAFAEKVGSMAGNLAVDGLVGF